MPPQGREAVALPMFVAAPSALGVVSPVRGAGQREEGVVGQAVLVVATLHPSSCPSAPGWAHPCEPGGSLYAPVPREERERHFGLSGRWPFHLSPPSMACLFPCLCLFPFPFYCGQGILGHRTRRTQCAPAPREDAIVVDWHFFPTSQRGSFSPYAAWFDLWDLWPSVGFCGPMGTAALLETGLGMRVAMDDYGD